MLLILLIFTLFLLLYNLAIYLPAKLFGVRVEKFYIWMDPGISLFKIQIKETEFGLGWLPLGSYVKLSGMFLDKGAAIEPYYFVAKSFLKQLIIALGGPLFCFFIGVIGYVSLGEVGTAHFTQMSLQLIAILALAILVFRLSRGAIMDRATRNDFQMKYVIGITGFYVLLLLAFGFYINEISPFFQQLQALFAGEYKIWDSQIGPENIVDISAFLGIWFFFFNVLPLGGFIGSSVISVLHKSFTGRDIPERITSRYAVLSFLLIIVMYAWLLFAVTL